jgi:DNA-binding CsgD family transcriptional regulator
MSRLSPNAFEGLLDDIYTAGEDHRHWSTVLAVLASQLSAPGGGLHFGARDGKGFSFGATHGVNPAALAAYAEYYYSINPLNAALSRIPVGAAAPDHHLVAPNDLARTEFYNDFARFSELGGSITLVLSRDDRHEACLGIVRGLGSDPFTEEQVSFVQRLAPHFRRAIGLNRRLVGLQDEHASLETALGSLETAVFVLDRTGVICFRNAAGEKLLKKRDGLKASQGRLYTDDSSTQNLLAGLTRAALAEKGARGGSLPVPRRCSTRPLLVKIMPIARRSEFWLNSAQPCAILFISDPDTLACAVVDEVMGAYGLTPSERKLLSELIAGRSLREAADILEITRATSRNRLARIMAKTDTHRQSELIQLILRSSIPVR